MSFRTGVLMAGFVFFATAGASAQEASSVELNRIDIDLPRRELGFKGRGLRCIEVVAADQVVRLVRDQRQWMLCQFFVELASPVD